MDKIISQPSGSLKISRDVLVTIAKAAAMEVEGVHALIASGGNSRLFGRRAIKIALSDDFAEITLSIRLKSGAHIPSVCAAIQSGVKDSIQTMTGIAVSKVNVVVAGIAFSEEKPSLEG